MSRKILVTSALVYANGPLHLGHLVEYIQSDIWVRFQRLRGNQCTYIAGDDTHGTPIMLMAQKRNITPETLIAEIYEQHKQDFKDFSIDLDYYDSTHSEQNKILTEWFYAELQAKNYIKTRTISQAFDAQFNMFLPDRYVKGECPHCQAPNQYGDSCEICGSTYNALDLKNPISVLSQQPPIQKATEHYFFKLPELTQFLSDWISKTPLQPEVSNKLMEWFKKGLQDIDITRDAPYFGFKIPGTVDKYFYVWIDAPIGYIAGFKNLCQNKRDLDFDDTWSEHSTIELYHFIGKDIINFHGIFWPALLKAAGLRTPTNLFVHGYLTINGYKMSKSRGTLISARDYLNQLDSEYLRYYFATKLSNKVEDIDLNLDDFMKKINADLIGKFVNIASRSAGFIHKYFHGVLVPSESPLIKHFLIQGEQITQDYENRDFSRAMRKIMELADEVNQYIAQNQPWVEIKQNPNKTHEICSLAIHLFRLLSLYLKPILPKTIKKVEEFLDIPPLLWTHQQECLSDHKILPFVPLLNRIEPEQIKPLGYSS